MFTRSLFRSPLAQCVCVVVALLPLAVVHAYTVPNKADDVGNRTIRCEDGTKFTHNGTYQQALDSAKISCQNHGNFVVPLEPERPTMQAPNKSAQAIGRVAPDAGGSGSGPSGSAASGAAIKQGVRPGVVQDR